MTIEQFLPNGINIMLILIVGFFIKHELHDIKTRITRIENTFFNRED